MIVADVNVVAYLLIEGAKTGLARAVFERDPAWALPALWRHEFLNVLAMQVQHGGFSLGIARETWRRAEELFSRDEREADAILSLELATKHKLSAYDAQYAALASHLGVPLVTEDRELLRKLPRMAVTMRDFGGS